ncbi:phospholipase D-like domain-containing protein [Candidatus Scalindua japonica]|nr:phospholipase D-like domain-containing protein [Candidatus Scalindua japonica]
MNRQGFFKKVDLIIVLLLSCISVFTVLFVSNSIYAATEVLFSPGGSIKDTIIKNISLSKNSIDVTAFTFTAGDIAEALYRAKERGVKIRVVIDRSQEAKFYPVIEFLKQEQFNLQFLQGNIGGSMNNAFAIFDDKLLVTGSYTWTEYSEKFNYENAVFIDQPDVVGKYKKEFESLYDKSVVQGAGRFEVVAAAAVSNKIKDPAKHGNVSNKGENVENSTTYKDDVVKFVIGKNIEHLNIPEDKHENKVDKQLQTIKEPLKKFVTISFDELDDKLGSGCTLEKSEKIRLWKDEFEGKYIRWTGRISFRGYAVYDWNKLGISHNNDSNIDVNLRFDYTKQRKVMKLKVGDIITYTGRLVSLSSAFSSYRVEDADVLQVIR